MDSLSNLLDAYQSSLVDDDQSFSISESSKSRSEFGSGHPFLGFKDVFYNSAIPTELKELVQSTEKEQSKILLSNKATYLNQKEIFTNVLSKKQNQLD